ncbi:hypothetical protein [Ramlibacter sp.]|jgi:hypothetical protein|uniref:hypothetical protein n=1 Tax=Ramlibacter sp. TaxID=1917967 RepID=UPI002A082B15|nr:hypothetical protein [Ramlibacter sp.]MCE3270992.1 hypothetical protein [Ramlibacter sp.]
MTARAPRSVDLRRFSSSLAPLQKMLDAQLQAARCSLGARKLEAVALADQVRQLQELEAAAVAAATASVDRCLDVRTHRHALLHLMDLAQQRAARETSSRAAERNVSDGMNECVERDRKLAVVQRLQDQQLRAQAVIAARRQSREADLEWLARTQGRESA